ncbi:MAG: ERCC4 domain-containing protein [Gammaproteobacteria bacterium]
MIVIDSSEPQKYKTRLTALAAARGVPTATERLETGDYRWLRDDGTDVLLERKAVPDLLSSLTDDRWGRQVSRLVDAGLPILLIEGTLQYRPDGSVTHDGYQARDWTVGRVDSPIVVAELAGLVVAHCGPGERAVAERVLHLYDLTRREEHASLLPRRYVPRQAQNEVAALALLSTLPGCGPKTAKGLIAKYGSAFGALQAVASGEYKGKPRWTEILNWSQAA